jgi:hypothetical protein
MVVVVVLPLLKLVVEDPGIIDDGPFKKPVELLGVDPMRAFLHCRSTSESEA